MNKGILDWDGKMDIVDGVERANGYWLDGVYHCDCDICNGGKCVCDHKFFLSNVKIDKMGVQ